MSTNVYEIRGKFTGAEAIAGNFKRIQDGAQKASRAIVTGARDEKQAQAEALRAQRIAANEQKRIWREQLNAQRLYIREMRKELSDLQKESQRATKIGAAGLTGLVATGAGLKTAGNLQDAMDDLRVSIMRAGKDGKVDMQALNAQMQQFEALAIRLGNNLPGSTRTMANLFSSMREGGMDAKLILGGAGEAAAFLAVTSKEDFEALGKVYAQLSTMAQIRPEDQSKVADLLARINTISGYKPTELIEAAKYSIPRGGLPLGLKGYAGLSSNLQLLGLMKRYGLEGSVGGEGIANLMERLPMNTPKAKKAGAKAGFEFFGKKGEFLGVENMIAQFEKLNKFSTKERASILHDVFGARGTPAAVAFSEIGLKGYKAYAQELGSVASLQDKINIETQKFGTLIENVKGTAENALAKTFLPLMQSLKPTIDRANVVLGAFGDFMGQHPTVSKYAAEVLALGSAALAGYAAFIKIKTAIQIYQITSRIAGAEKSLVNSLQATSGMARQLTTNIESASGTVRGSGSKLGGGIASSITSAIGVGVTAFAIETVVADLMNRGISEVERRKSSNELKELQKQREAIAAELRSGKMLPGAGMAKLQELDRQIGEKMAEKEQVTRTGSYTSNGSEFAKQLASIASNPIIAAARGERGLDSVRGPYGWVMTLADAAKGDAYRRAEFKREQIPSFSSASQLSAWMEAIQKSGAFDEAQVNVLRQLVGEKYPQYMQELGELSTATKDASGSIRDWVKSLSSYFPLPSTGGTSTGSGTGTGAAPSSQPQKRFFNRQSLFLPSSYSEPRISATTVQAIASGQTTPRINLTVHVDARGASHPAEVETVVKAAVHKAVAESHRQIGEIAERHMNDKYRDRQLAS
jgi:TP901 family phage tail tape measure protein